MKPSVLIVSACDFPNGLAAANRIRMFGRCFKEIGFQVHCLFQYAPGIMVEGVNTQVKGKIDGIEFCYPIGTLKPPRSLVRMLLYKTWGLWRVLRAATQLASRQPVHYILSYGNTGFEDKAYLRLAHRIGARYILEICDLHSIVLNETSLGLKRQKERLKFWFNEYKDRSVVPRSDCLFLISRYLCEHYSRLFPSDRILLTPIIGDKDEFQVMPAWHKSETCRLLWLGNFRPFEGLEFLVEALADVRERGGDFHCNIFAVSPKHSAFAQTIQTAIDQRGLTRCVTLNKTVPKSHLLQMLRDSHIMMVPRRDSELNRSNFPTKMVDYLFSGKPIVSSRVGEIPLYCQDGVHIVYPTDNTPGAFATAVLGLMDDPERAARLGLQARRLAEEMFDYRQLAPKIAAFLGRLPSPLSPVQR